ncbi:glycosyltransferase [Frondihabitans sp. Leaf304]|uniref:glycosyltransferase n=1 Tax=Frondihabitans sp. Leaf304 TaxID=1736329 RepID=UPI000A8FB5E0|nr:glycosyl transferase [Frondihabitans sp. Leaf304]
MSSTVSSRRGRGKGSAFIVQQSFPRPRPTTNPYLVMLGDAVSAQPGVTLRTFSWKSALLTRSDVFHVHWPEILVSGQSPVKKLVRQALTVALVAKLAVTRTPIVRTLHNLERPSGISRREVALLALIERRTTLWIRLNDETPTPSGQASELIPHGHYRDWFERFDKPDALPGRIGFVGLIRRYKGVERLVEVFRSVPGAASLHVAGKPSTDELAEHLRGLADDDARVSLDLRFLDEAALVESVRRSELVVLPYREMHNSGGVLTALSLDRPVLVPQNAVTERLAAEVGPGWVHRYEGDLSTDDIVTALHDPRPADSHPDLAARDWRDAGERHVAAYRRAVAVLRSGRRSGVEQ